MDRARILEDLVLHSLDSRAAAAEVRGRLDTSYFDEFASLVVLVADHDVHRPDAPGRGAARRASIHAHVDGVLTRATRRGAPAHQFAGQDRQAELASSAMRILARLAGRGPSDATVPELLARALGEPLPPRVPRQPRRGHRPR